MYRKNYEETKKFYLMVINNNNINGNIYKQLCYSVMDNLVVNQLNIALYIANKYSKFRDEYSILQMRLTRDICILFNENYNSIKKWHLHIP